MDYSVAYDDISDEWIATAGDDTYNVPSVHLAYLWLAQQIADDDSE